MTDKVAIRHRLFGRLSAGCLFVSGILTAILFVSAFLFSPFDAAGAAEFEADLLNTSVSPFAPSSVSLDLPATSYANVGMYPDSPGGNTLSLITVNPPIARPETDTTVVVRVTNNLPVTLPYLTAKVAIGSAPLTTRSGLADWLTGTAEANTIVVASQEITELTPGASQDVFFRISTELFPEIATSRGSRPMSITLYDENERNLGQSNSVFIFDPGTTPLRPLSATPPRLGLSFIAPLSGALLNPATLAEYGYDYGDNYGEILPSLEPPILFADNARFAQVVTAATTAGELTGNPAAFALAVDPALIALAGYSLDGFYPVDEEMPNWVAELMTAGDQGLRIYQLPPFDPDIAALAHAGVLESDFYLATNAVLPNDFQVPQNWRSQIAWPADWLTPDLATMRSAASDFDLFLAPAGMRARWGTITGLAVYGADEHNLTVLINDDRLAESFFAATSAVELPLQTTAESLSKFLAELAIIIEQNPDNPPHLLVALPRDWEPNLGEVNNVFSVLAQTNWINVSPLNVLMNQPIPTAERVGLPALLVHDGELTPAEVQRLVSARSNLTAYISAAQDPNTLISQAEPLLMLPLSQAWRNYYLAQQSASEEIDAAAIRTEMIERNFTNAILTTGSMQITAAGLTLISDTGNIPLNIHNSLPSPAVVRVVLTAQDSRLLVEDTPTVTIPAGVTQLVYVPVTAIASGDVLVSVELQSESGQVITQAEDLELRIRAGWETVSTGAVAVLLGVLFTAGIIRNVKRGKAPTRDRATAVVDPEIFDRSA